MLNRSASLAMSTSVLKALPGKHDIKRHSPSILYFDIKRHSPSILYLLHMATSGTVIPHVIKSDLCKSIPGGKKQQSDLHNILIVVIQTPVKRHKTVLSNTHVQ